MTLDKSLKSLCSSTNLFNQCSNIHVNQQEGFVPQYLYAYIYLHGKLSVGYTKQNFCEIPYEKKDPLKSLSCVIKAFLWCKCARCEGPQLMAASSYALAEALPLLEAAHSLRDHTRLVSLAPNPMMPSPKYHPPYTSLSYRNLGRHDNFIPQWMWSLGGWLHRKNQGDESKCVRVNVMVSLTTSSVTITEGERREACQNRVWEVGLFLPKGLNIFVSFCFPKTAAFWVSNRFYCLPSWMCFSTASAAAGPARVWEMLEDSSSHWAKGKCKCSW